MYKKPKKKKKPNDGGLPLEQLIHYYPKAEKIRKGLLNLTEEEKQHITEYMLKKGLKPFCAFAIFETVLIVIMGVLCTSKDIDPNDRLFFIALIAMTIALIIGGYVWLKRKNKKRLSTIDFSRIEEVLLTNYISNKGNKQLVFFLRWDEDKQKYYHVNTHSDLFLTMKSDQLVYHPCGTDFFIPE